MQKSMRYIYVYVSYTVIVAYLTWDTTWGKQVIAPQLHR